MKKILSKVQVLGLLAILQLLVILTTQDRKTSDLENKLSIRPAQIDVCFTGKFERIN